MDNSIKIEYPEIYQDKEYDIQRFVYTKDDKINVSKAKEFMEIVKNDVLNRPQTVVINPYENLINELNTMKLSSIQKKSD